MGSTAFRGARKGWALSHTQPGACERACVTLVSLLCHTCFFQQFPEGETAKKLLLVLLEI